MVCGKGVGSTAAALIEHMHGHKFRELAFLAIAHYFKEKPEYDAFMEEFRASKEWSMKIAGFAFNRYDTNYEDLDPENDENFEYIKPSLGDRGGVLTETESELPKPNYDRRVLAPPVSRKLCKLNASRLIKKKNPKLTIKPVDKQASSMELDDDNLNDDDSDSVSIFPHPLVT